MLTFKKCIINFTLLIIIILMINHTQCDPTPSPTPSPDYGKAINETCSINFHCQSGCCSSKKCKEAKDCKDFIKKIYTIQVIVCVALVFIFSNYLLIYLRNIKKKFTEKISNNAYKQ